MAKTRRLSGRAGKIIVFLFGLVFFGIGAAFTYSTYQFLENALPATGQVISVDVNRSDDGTTYKPRFIYVDANGQQQRGTTAISSSGYDFAIGEKMDILYDTRNPAKVSLTGWFNTWGFGAIFVIAGLIPMVISRFIGRRKARTRQPEPDDLRDKYVRLDSPESDEDHKRETEYTPTVRRN